MRKMTERESKLDFKARKLEQELFSKEAKIEELNNIISNLKSTLENNKSRVDGLKRDVDSLREGLEMAQNRIVEIKAQAFDYIISSKR